MNAESTTVKSVRYIVLPNLPVPLLAQLQGHVIAMHTAPKNPQLKCRVKPCEPKYSDELISSQTPVHSAESIPSNLTEHTTIKQSINIE